MEFVRKRGRERAGAVLVSTRQASATNEHQPDLLHAYQTVKGHCPKFFAPMRTPIGLSHLLPTTKLKEKNEAATDSVSDSTSLYNNSIKRSKSSDSSATKTLVL